MSVQQEHLNAVSTLAKSEAKAESSPLIADHVKVAAPPKLEYNNPSRDSLAMLGAAIGGALLGVFLTLLVLAIVNRGTIRFNTTGQIRAMQETIVAVDQNVGALSANLDTVVARLEGLQGQADVIPGLQTEINAAKTEIGAALSEIGAAQETLKAQQSQLGEMNDSIAVLDVGRQKFDVFTGALAGALSQMSALDGPAEAAAVEVAAVEVAPVDVAPVEAAAVEVAPIAPVLPTVTVAASADVAGDAVQVVYFADANGNGIKEGEEASVVGMSLNLVDAGGAIVASVETDESGAALFVGLAAGSYSLTTAEGDAIASLTVAEGAAQGQIVTVPVVE